MEVKGMKKLICQSHLKSNVEIELRPPNCQMMALSMSLADGRDLLAILSENMTSF